MQQYNRVPTGSGLVNGSGYGSGYALNSLVPTGAGMVVEQNAYPANSAPSSANYGSGVVDPWGQLAREGPAVSDAHVPQALSAYSAASGYGFGGFRVPKGTMRNGSVEACKYVPYSATYAPPHRDSADEVLRTMKEYNPEAQMHAVAPPITFTVTPMTHGSGLVEEGKTVQSKAKKLSFNHETADPKMLGQYATKDGPGGGVVPTNLFFRNNAQFRNPAHNVPQPPSGRTILQSETIYQTAKAALAGEADLTVRGINQVPALPVYLVTDYKKPVLATNRPAATLSNNIHNSQLSQPGSGKQRAFESGPTSNLGNPAAREGQGKFGGDFLGDDPTGGGRSKYLDPANRERELLNKTMLPNVGNDRAGASKMIADAIQRLAESNISQSARPAPRPHNKLSEAAPLVYGWGFDKSLLPEKSSKKFRLIDDNDADERKLKSSAFHSAAGPMKEVLQSKVGSGGSGAPRRRGGCSTSAYHEHVRQYFAKHKGENPKDMMSKCALAWQKQKLKKNRK